jgi:hypothetical protein
LNLALKAIASCHFWLFIKSAASKILRVKLRSFLEELKRRNVFQAAIGFAAAAFP